MTLYPISRAGHFEKFVVADGDRFYLADVVSEEELYNKHTEKVVAYCGDAWYTRKGDSIVRMDDACAEVSAAQDRLNAVTSKEGFDYRSDPDYDAAFKAHSTAFFHYLDAMDTAFKAVRTDLMKLGLA
ncbi:MAG: hypothetical protein IJS47_05490 [Clostridia bacterium]|nr:hypothetical protein [Clostridia bacterium]